MNQRQTEQQRQFGAVAINKMFFGGQTVRQEMARRSLFFHANSLA